MHDPRLVTSARRALAGCFVCVAVASGVLVTAIVRHDFRFASVAEHSSREVPQPYLISSFWSSQEGSLLLWLLVLSGLSALVTYQHRRRSRELMPYLVAFLGGACAFFAFATSFVASPFETVAQVPRDGSGLVPSLQNPYMLTHPPLLYLGYVGFTIPFAFAMAALVSGRTDGRWLQAVRRWTLVPWLALGVGMLLGAKWAYEEIGWGGFWGWDPVENAALIPWLTATAFLHSVIVQEKKGMLKVWNVSLVALTYVLCIVGTFLTRSGFTSSIHTFVVSSVGWWFIGYIAIVATVSIIVIVRNLDQLRSPHRIDSLVSREATFLFNNLLFVALAFAILWGVLFPSISEALAGHRVATQSPYYDFFAVVLGLPLLLLAGIGPVVAWRRASLRGVVQAFRWPFVSALAAGRAARPARLRLERARHRGAQPLPLRHGHDRARAGARDGRAPRALAGHVVAGGARAARRSQPPALRRVRRAPRGHDRRRRDRRHERVRDQPHARARARADGCSSTATACSCARSSRRSRAATSRRRRSSTSTRAAIASTRCARRRAPTSTPASRPSRSRSARCCAPARISTSCSTARRGRASSRSRRS